MPNITIVEYEIQITVDIDSSYPNPVLESGLTYEEAAKKYFQIDEVYLNNKGFAQSAAESIDVCLVQFYKKDGNNILFDKILNHKKFIFETKLVLSDSFEYKSDII